MPDRPERSSLRWHGSGTKLAPGTVLRPDVAGAGCGDPDVEAALEDGEEDVCHFDVVSLPSSAKHTLALAVGGLATHWAESSATSTIDGNRVDALLEQAKKALKALQAPREVGRSCLRSDGLM